MYAQKCLCQCLAATDNDLSLTLPLRALYTDGTELLYDFTVDWGDGTSSEVTGFDDPDKSHVYAQAGTYTVKMAEIAQGFPCERWEDLSKMGCRIRRKQACRGDRTR